MTTAWEEVVAVVADPLQMGVTNIAKDADVNFSYTAATNGKLTITLATASMFATQNDYVSGTYTINNGETVELAKGANVIDLNEGDTIVINVISNTAGKMTAAWEEVVAVVADPLQMGNTNIAKDADVNFSYTAATNGKLTITLATASMFATQNDYVSGTYTINNGETVELAKGANVIDLNEGDTIVINVISNTAGKMTTAWEASATNDDAETPNDQDKDDTTADQDKDDTTVDQDKDDTTVDQDKDDTTADQDKDDTVDQDRDDTTVDQDKDDNKNDNKNDAKSDSR